MSEVIYELTSDQSKVQIIKGVSDYDPSSPFPLRITCAQDNIRSIIVRSSLYFKLHKFESVGPRYYSHYYEYTDFVVIRFLRRLGAKWKEDEEGLNCSLDFSGEHFECIYKGKGP